MKQFKQRERIVSGVGGEIEMQCILSGATLCATFDYFVEHFQINHTIYRVSNLIIINKKKNTSREQPSKRTGQATQPTTKT